MPSSYGDMDQSPLKGDEAQFHKTLWSKGMDYYPHEKMFTHLSDWLKIIFAGDYKAFMKIIDDTPDDQLGGLLERRESLLNVSAIFHVIIGARSLSSEHVQEAAKKTLNVKNEHMKIFDELLELGVDVNVHDSAGYTPLHHCLTLYGNSVTEEMAKKLIKAGAKINAKNRMGSTALMEAALSVKYEYVELLLQHGADPTVPDNDDKHMANISVMNPRLQELLKKYYKKAVREEKAKAEAASNESRCCKCGKDDEEMKKCTGCYMVWYCSRECQRLDWSNQHKTNCKLLKQKRDSAPAVKQKQCSRCGNKSNLVRCSACFNTWYCDEQCQEQDQNHHQSECRDGQDEYKLCTFDQEFVSSIGSDGFTFRDPKQKSSKSFFTVKVQTPMPLPSGEPVRSGPLAIYNKDKSFMKMLRRENNEFVYEELRKNIAKEGYLGMKGYFHAMLDNCGDSSAAGRLKIKSGKILPLQPW